MPEESIVICTVADTYQWKMTRLRYGGSSSAASSHLSNRASTT